VSVHDLQGSRLGEGSAEVRARVLAARAVQTGRFTRGEVTARTNADLGPHDLPRVAAPDDAGRQVLLSAVERLGLSARAYGKILRVARTIADLDKSCAVRAAHVAEAIHTRLLDRQVGPPLAPFEAPAAPG
jgi:magnesium chelatase family protein